MLSHVLSVLVYAGSALLLAVVVASAPAMTRLLRGTALVLGGSALLAAAALEVPLTGLPFWSRDFSLTWTVMVATLGAAVALVAPRLLAALRSRRGVQPTPLSGGRASGTIPNGEPSDVARRDLWWNEHGPKPFALASVPKARIGAILAGALLLLLYAYGVERSFQRVNTDPSRVDQSAYLSYANRIQQSEFSYVGNRNRMPAYPFFLALTLDDPGAPTAFAQAKMLNSLLSIGLLTGIGLLLFRRLPALAAATLILITAFELFAYKAAYVQAELLFYALSFGPFVLMIDSFRRPSLGGAVALGILAGLAQLTKASELPVMVVFAAVVAGSSAVAGVKLARGGGDGKVTTVLPEVLRLGVVLAFFLLTILPYIKNSWYRYGHPFYNVNSTFYVWYDSWAEVEQGTRAHGDRVGWPDMPPDQIPSPSKYLREHRLSDIAARLGRGIGLTVSTALDSFSYAGPILFLGTALASAAFLEKKRLLSWIGRHRALAVFLVAYFGLQLLAFSWFAEMVDGNRLVLVMLVPLLFILALGIQTLLSGRAIRWGRRQLSLSDALFAMAFIVVLADILFRFPGRIGVVWGGS